MVGTIHQKSVNHRRVGSDGVGGGGEGGERASQKVEVGLLLAMDYSGMDELEQGQAALDDTALLAGVDGQVSEGRRRTVTTLPPPTPTGRLADQRNIRMPERFTISTPQYPSTENSKP